MESVPRRDLSRDPQAARIARPWGVLARAAWLLAAGGYITLWALGTRVRLFGPLPDCQAVLCDNIEFSAGDVQVLAQLELPAILNHHVWHSLEVPYSIGFFVIAGLIFWRRSDHPVGLLLSASLIYAGAMLFTGADDPLRRSYPELRWLVSMLDIAGFVTLALVLLTFPDGRFLGRRLPLLAGGFMAAGIAVPLISGGSSRVQGPEVPPLATALSLLLLVLMIGVGLGSQVHRYRRVSSPLQRQQTKWVLFGLAGQGVVVLMWGYIGYFYPPSEPSPARVAHVLVATPLILGLSALVPITVAFAILRYRLFDIDRLINRALAYGILTAILAISYLIGVVVLQGLFATLGLGRGPLAVVISTLAIAGMFSPLRRRVQDFIDRRFYRSRYDAQRLVQRFGADLRDELDLEGVSELLLRSVQDSIEPVSLSLWLRDRS